MRPSHNIGGRGTESRQQDNPQLEEEMRDRIDPLYVGQGSELHVMHYVHEEITPKSGIHRTNKLSLYSAT